MEDKNGWIVSIVLGVLGATKFIWDYLKKRNDNNTTLKLKNNISQNEQYKELLSKFTDLEIKFEETERRFSRALDAFEIIFPIIETVIKEKPDLKAVMDKAIKHFQQN